VSAAHAQQDIGARHLLAACQSEKEGDRATCVGFMVGFISAAHEVEIMIKRPFISCSTAATILFSGETLARKSHRTKARLGGYSERRVCSVVSMPAGGASRREECWNHFALPAQRRSGLGGPWDDAARTTRCGGACQAGEPRALAAAARRRATCPQTSAAGQADAIPTLIRRTLNFTKAPILSNLRRMVPQVALAKCV